MKQQKLIVLRGCSKAGKSFEMTEAALRIALGPDFVERAKLIKKSKAAR